MKKKMFILGVLILAGLVMASTTSILAQEVELDTSDDLAFTRIKPVLVKKKGQDVGSMVVEIEIKNIGSKPAQFIVFASGRVEGGWAGGRAILPKKGQLAPQETTKGKIKTKYVGKQLPSVVKIEGSKKMF